MHADATHLRLIITTQARFRVRNYIIFPSTSIYNSDSTRVARHQRKCDALLYQMCHLNVLRKKIISIRHDTR